MPLSRSTLGVLTRDRLVVLEGDSLTYGGQTGASDYPSIMSAAVAALNAETWAIVSVATSGQKLTTMVTDAATQVDPLYSLGGFTKRICVVWGGTNDCVNESAETAYARLVTWGQARQAVGWQVVVCTLQAGAPAAAGGTFNTTRNAFNALVLANWATFANVVADLGATLHLGADADEDDTTYYNADKTHLTTTGYGVAAGVIQTAIASL